MANPHKLNSKSPPTRFRDGVTNIGVDQSNNTYPAQDPTRTFEFYDDFQNPADLIIASPITWTKTVTGTGAITQVTGASGAGGRIQIATTGASGDSTELQAKSDGFSLTTTNRWWVKFKCQVSNASDTDVVIGLQKIGTTPLAPTDGVYYLKANGAATGVVKLMSASTATTSATVNTVVAATDFTIGFSYDPFSKNDSGTLGAVKIYLNDQQVGIKLVPTNIPTGALAPVMFIKTNSANARNLVVDYLFCANDRNQFEPVR